VGVLPPGDPAPAEARQPPRHSLVETTAHPDRHAARLPRFRHHVDPLEREPPEIDRRPRLPPERLTHLEREVELSPACTEVEPGGVVLLPLPADADAEIEPAVREHVEGRRRLR